MRPRPPVRLAEVNDLTVPEQNYREHLSELHKLPPFMRICSAQNMLTYCGQHHTKAQLLLSVPSCRVPPRHSVFAKVSLNVGPGDYEWFIGKFRSWVKIRDVLRSGWTNNKLKLSAWMVACRVQRSTFSARQDIFGQLVARSRSLR